MSPGRRSPGRRMVLALLEVSGEATRGWQSLRCSPAFAWGEICVPRACRHPVTGAVAQALPRKGHPCRRSSPCAPSIRTPAWLHCPILPFIPAIPAGPRLKVLPNGQLHLLRASPGDAGTYLCVAHNPSGTAVGRTRLIVQGKAG